MLAPLATIAIEVLAKNVTPGTLFENTPYVQLGPFLTIATPCAFPNGNMARVAALVFALLLHPAQARVADLRALSGMSALVIEAVVLGASAWSHLAVGNDSTTVGSSGSNRRLSGNRPRLD